MAKQISVLLPDSKRKSDSLDVVSLLLFLRQSQEIQWLQKTSESVIKR
jgi:hypothetical protein